MASSAGILTIDLNAIRQNYALLDSLSAKSCETAPAVKANAYGLGVNKVAPALYKAGARSFFVAHLDEAINLRPHIMDTNIYILHGFDDKNADAYKEHNFIPVLNSLHDLKSYQRFASKSEHEMPAALHFDTGMNRLGISSDEAKVLCENLSLIDGITLDFIMSHFSSADEKDSPTSNIQHKKFLEITKHFKGVRRSICNSSGTLIDNNYHMEMTRPGIGLYGGNPAPYVSNPMSQVITLFAPILQIHAIKSGEGIGYNAAYRFHQNGAVAIVSSGYGDGILKTLGNQGALFWRGHKLPIRGHVSMDLLICDLCNVPENDYPRIGDMAEIIGPNQTIDDLAKDANTISYEIITSLGSRYTRLHTD